jgi:hypothetical protein
MSKKHVSSTIDDFLKREGVFQEVQARLLKKWSRGRAAAIGG